MNVAIAVVSVVFVAMWLHSWLRLRRIEDLLESIAATLAAQAIHSGVDTSAQLTRLRSESSASGRAYVVAAIMVAVAAVAALAAVGVAAMM